MTLPVSGGLPEPTGAPAPRAEVFLGYLDYFRSVLVDKVQGLSDVDLRSSRLPSGWTPLALLVHLTYVERRWLGWGFEGEPFAEPWGDSRDSRDGRWYVGPQASLSSVVEALLAQGERTRAVVQSHELSDVGRPGPRWDGAPPPALERVLFHLLQEYARHAGHLDVVRELVDGAVGE